MAYDPQKTRNRPVPAADRPAPVDAFLDAMSEVTVPPEGNDSEVTSGGDTAGEEIFIDYGNGASTAALRDKIVDRFLHP